MKSSDVRFGAALPARQFSVKEREAPSSLDRRVFINEEDLIVWSKVLILLHGDPHHHVAAIGQVNLRVKNMLT